MKQLQILFFSEAHSHATEQKLVKDDIDRVINDIHDRIPGGHLILYKYNP